MPVSPFNRTKRHLKKTVGFFLGPMLSPKGFGPRADSGLPISGQANDGFTENAWMPELFSCWSFIYFHRI